MDLIMVLQKMGAIISVDVDRVITIVGVKRMRGFDHTTIPDRLEAASLGLAPPSPPTAASSSATRARNT